MPHRHALGALAALLLCTPSLAAAQSFDWRRAQPVYQPPIDVIGEAVADPRNPFLKPRLRLGVRSSIAPLGPALSGGGYTPDAPTFGLGPQASFLVPLHEHFALGARGALTLWIYDDDYELDGEGDQRTWDLAPVVELRLPMNRFATLYIDAYGGLSVNQWIADGEAGSNDGTGFHAGGALGWELFVDRFGFFFEAALTYRRATHDTLWNERTVEIYDNTITLGLIVGF